MRKMILQYFFVFRVFMGRCWNSLLIGKQLNWRSTFLLLCIEVFVWLFHLACCNARLMKEMKIETIGWRFTFAAIFDPTIIINSAVFLYIAEILPKWHIITATMTNRFRSYSFHAWMNRKGDIECHVLSINTSATAFFGHSFLALHHIFRAWILTKHKMMLILLRRLSFNF